MRLPFWVLRWLHRRRLSRSRLRGTFLHSWLGDRLLDRALWKPSRDSLARAWLVGFPVTVIPFLPIQSLFACFLALFVRGNVLLCIALQFLSTPLTAPVHLPACYWVGEVVRGRAPGEVWREVTAAPRSIFSGDAVTSLYLGALIIGVVGGIAGYFIIRHTWKHRPRPAPAARPYVAPGSPPPKPERCVESCEP